MAGIIDAVPNRHRIEVVTALIHPGSRRSGPLDITGFECLWILEMPGRDLKIPVRVGLEPDSAGHRIQAAEIEVPPILVGLATIEHRPFERPPAAIDRPRYHAKRDVRRVRSEERRVGKERKSR